MTERTSNGTGIIWSLWDNAKVNIPIWFAVAGLLCAVIVLHSKFHDLSLDDRKTVARTYYSDRIDRIALEIHRLEAVRGPRSSKDSANIKDTLSRYKHLYKETRLALVNLDHFNIDTSLSFYARMLSGEREEVLRSVLNGDTTIAVTLRDSCCSISDTAVFVRKVNLNIYRKPKNLVGLFERDPSLGVWFFLSLAQMVLWFLIAPLMIGNARGSNQIVPEFSYNSRNGFRIALVPIAVLAIFTFILYWALIDVTVIPDSYFMDDFDTRMLWYSVPGYLIAGLCFSVYLFVANKLELLNGIALHKKLSMSSDAGLQSQYQQLKTSFDFAFFCSAIILSVFVIWLGTLFNGVNNLEAVRFYTLLSGKPLLSYDFVYLIGLIHSLLLVIFYIPVRLQFNNLQLTQDKRAIDALSANSSTTVFRTLGGIIGSILITASPLLTTLVQKGLSGLLG
jgi:hypothetical protein